MAKRVNSGLTGVFVCADREKLADPFFKLEHASEDVQRARTAVPLLTQLKVGGVFASTVPRFSGRSAAFLRQKAVFSF